MVWAEDDALVVKRNSPRSSRLDLPRVEAALDGDAAAIDAVLDDWLPTVYAWCGRLGAGRIDAEEAAHDVMMVFVRRHRTVASPAQLPAWLFGTCRRVVANHRRHAWWRRWLPGATVQERVAPERTDRSLEERELAEQVARVLDDLTEAHREVLVLCYLEDRSVAEASELLGLPEGTVKSRLFHARSRFRDHFPVGGPS